MMQGDSVWFYNYLSQGRVWVKKKPKKSLSLCCFITPGLSKDIQCGIRVKGKKRGKGEEGGGGVGRHVIIEIIFDRLLVYFCCELSIYMHVDMHMFIVQIYVLKFNGLYNDTPCYTPMHWNILFLMASSPVVRIERISRS